MAAAVTQISRIGGGIQAEQRRERWLYLFLFMLLLWFVLISTVTLRFLLPRQLKITPGSLHDFPPRSAPYEVLWSGLKLFIVNSGDELFVLDGRNPQPTWRCGVIWVDSNQRFEDPCSGSKFALNGGYLEGPAQRHMDRYVVKVDKYYQLQIDSSQTLLETQAEFTKRCFAGLASVSSSSHNPLWGRKADDFCTRLWEMRPRDPATGQR